MFGTYRFILAAFVALSHFGLVVYGFNPGQWAVLSFYVISGFLMAKLFQKNNENALIFYTDRFLRIYPLYLLVVFLSVAFFICMRRNIVSNIFLLPLNYSEFTGTHAVIPPAWSLACEIQFYLLVPILCKLKTDVLKYLTLASVIFFVFTPFLPHSTFWAYMSLPGILFAFLSGILLSRRGYLTMRSLQILFIIIFIVFSL